VLLCKTCTFPRSCDQIHAVASGSWNSKSAHIVVSAVCGWVMTVGPISALAVHNLSSGTSAFILVVKVDWINKHVCTVVLNWYFNPESMKSYLYARLIEVHGPCSDPSGKLGINNWVSKLKQTHLNGNVWREYVFLWAIFGGDQVRILLCYLLFMCVCVSSVLSDPRGKSLGEGPGWCPSSRHWRRGPVKKLTWVQWGALWPALAPSRRNHRRTFGPRGRG